MSELPLDIDGEAISAIEALPRSALAALAEAFTVLRLVPWNGLPYNAQHPKRPMRTLTFDAGRGLIVYLVVEDLERVDVLQVTWFGCPTRSPGHGDRECPLPAGNQSLHRPGRDLAPAAPFPRTHMLC